MLQEFHLSDRELLMAMDGECSARDAARVESHLSACWACRARKQELEGAIGKFVRFQKTSLGNLIPSADGPSALLKARLHRLIEAERSWWPRWLRLITRPLNYLAAAATLLLGSVALFLYMQPRYSYQVVTVPNPSFTPGATILLNQQEICSKASVRNKAVPPPVQRRVFAEYGIRTVESGAYEVDYLITPALGGADDIHNLWPQSSREAVWNSYVKDELEDRLRDLVCDGQLDLTTAQRELAGNWIAAYKKYFRSDRPVTSSH